MELWGYGVWRKEEEEEDGEWERDEKTVISRKGCLLVRESWEGEKAREVNR